jgi:hypothetical protein
MSAASTADLLFVVLAVECKKRKVNIMDKEFKKIQFFQRKKSP